MPSIIKKFWILFLYFLAPGYWRYFLIGYYFNSHYDCKFFLFLFFFFFKGGFVVGFNHSKLYFCRPSRSWLIRLINCPRLFLKRCPVPCPYSNFLVLSSMNWLNNLPILGIAGIPFLLFHWLSVTLFLLVILCLLASAFSRLKISGTQYAKSKTSRSNKPTSSATRNYPIVDWHLASSLLMDTHW